MSAVNYAIQNHLGGVDETGAMVPELAESWEVANGAKTWVFNLRQDVEFHNGKTLDADDVSASFQHHMGETKSPAKSLLKQVKSIRKDGKYTVVFELSGGNADFPFVASDYHIAIKQAWDGGKISPNDGLGTGPYVLPLIHITVLTRPLYLSYAVLSLNKTILFILSVYTFLLSYPSLLLVFFFAPFISLR